MVAAGVWSGELLSQATGEAAWAKTLQPRRGHLLELPRPEGMPVVKRGMMEMSYTKVRSVWFYRPRGCRKGAQGANLMLAGLPGTSIDSVPKGSGWQGVGGAPRLAPA